MLFHTTDELQITTHRVLKALTLCDETIKVQTSPPSAAHMWAYMAVVNGKLSGTQPLPSNGEEGHHLSPSNPHPGGRTPQHLQANFGDVTDNELWQLMEELCREIALWELNAPPESHHKHLGGILWEMGILMQITGRSPFQEGEGGFPHSNHFDLLALHNQIEGGSPEDNLLAPSSCSTWWGCRVPIEYTSHRVATQYPWNQHLQQQCYTG